MSEEYEKKDLTKLKILAAMESLSTNRQICERTGFNEATVRAHVLELKDHVLHVTNVYPMLYMANPAKPFVPKPKMTERERRRKKYLESINKSPDPLPVARSQVLSSLGGYEYYIPVISRTVDEKHPKAPSRRRTPHIGCGSYAHVDMFG